MQQENCTAQLGQWLAGSENGSVYYCQETEVVSLCLHYIPCALKLLHSGICSITDCP